jgi:hypothetical protein
MLQVHIVRPCPRFSRLVWPTQHLGSTVCLFEGRVETKYLGSAKGSNKPLSTLIK